jgi:hypothetical protein
MEKESVRTETMGYGTLKKCLLKETAIRPTKLTTAFL